MGQAVIEKYSTMTHSGVPVFIPKAIIFKYQFAHVNNYLFITEHF